METHLYFGKCNWADGLRGMGLRKARGAGHCRQRAGSRRSERVFLAGPPGEQAERAQGSPGRAVTRSPTLSRLPGVAFPKLACSEVESVY